MRPSNSAESLHSIEARMSRPGLGVRHSPPSTASATAHGTSVRTRTAGRPMRARAACRLQKGQLWWAGAVANVASLGLVQGHAGAWHLPERPNATESQRVAREGEARAGGLTRARRPGAWARLPCAVADTAHMTRTRDRAPGQSAGERVAWESVPVEHLDEKSGSTAFRSRTT